MWKFTHKFTVILGNTKQNGMIYFYVLINICKQIPFQILLYFCYIACIKSCERSLTQQFLRKFLVMAHVTKNSNWCKEGFPQIHKGGFPQSHKDGFLHVSSEPLSLLKWMFFINIELIRPLHHFFLSPLNWNE